MTKRNKSRLTSGTAIKAIPNLTKNVLTGNFAMAKYSIKNAMVNRLRFQFPEKDMVKYFDSLPDTKSVENNELVLKDKIAIMTFDDLYDKEIVDYEESIDAKSTFFLLSYETKGHVSDKRADLQFHFDKRFANFDSQFESVKKKIGKKPIANRHHTLWWKHNHHDLLFLAMKGLKIDSSLTGTKPFQLCVQGKLLPIWEVPFNISDSPYLLSAPYNVAKNMEALFSKKVSPAVGLFHPQDKETSSWKKFYKLAKKYGYSFMTMSEFYNAYLKRK